MKPFALLCCALLAGCTVGPDYKKPEMAAPSAFVRPAGVQHTPYSSPVAVSADLSQWWTKFDDTELQSLVGRALVGNPDLDSAASRVREARQQEIIAGAASLPQVNATANAAHLHSGSNLLEKIGGGGATGGAPATTGSTDIKLYSLGFDASWEIDVFGGIRRSIEAAQANSDAALWQLRDGEVSLSAEVANDYFTLRSTQSRLAVLRSEVKSQQDVLALTAARRRTGFVTQLDVNQQESLVSSTLAQIPQLEAEQHAMQDALAVLLGATPGTLDAELERSRAMPPIPSRLPIGLPSDLLRRRPDVRAAERKLAAATAEIGVATSDLYPKFDLLAGISVASNHFSNLFSSANLGEIGLGSIMWPIFKGGQITANINAKTEEKQQAYDAYKKSVLGAIQDADDALARFIKEQARYEALQHEVATSASSVKLAEEQYRIGLVTYVTVLTAQSTLLSARDQLEQSRLALATDTVSLYKALGGGWQDADVPAAPAG
jgi:NodT family efflux transporter outer membrane factor (OMF) lipoprotein